MHFSDVKHMSKMCASLRKDNDVCAFIFWGICGTFMGGLAMLARSLGHQVTGSDTNIYPPMSTLLEKEGIDLIQGYDASQLDPAPDLVIVGNVMKRGNPCVEAVLEKTFRLCPARNGCTILSCGDRWVVAIAGTHGKTTTAGMATGSSKPVVTNPAL
ncbi:hypothetical protein CWS02_23815 [Enterobacter sp. EA-1]|nr:hypothetical protein CWS02_23815 [Enterobacter sp. EA-1]